MDMERRQFLKMGLAAGAGLAASGTLGALGYAFSGRHVARTTSNFHDWVDTACTICPAGCGLRVFVDGSGLPVYVSGTPNHPVNNGKICAKGIANLNLYYHPERLIKAHFTNRNGKNPAETGMDAAVKNAAELIRKAKAEGATFLVDSQGNDPELFDDFFSKLGVDRVVVSRPVATENYRKKLFSSVYGQPDVQPELSRADLILVIGANPFEGGDHYIALAKAIADARVNNNARMIVIDPRNTRTAGRADFWLPIVPGQDLQALTFFEKLWKGHKGEFKGLNEDEIHLLARLLQDSHRPAFIAGWGVYAQPDAPKILDALCLMEKAHGGSTFTAQVPDRKSATLTELQNAYDRIAAEKGKWFLLSHRSNPVYEGRSGGLNVMLDALSSKETMVGHVSISPFVNETNVLADVILPEVVPLEDRGLIPAPWHADRPSWTEQKAVKRLVDGPEIAAAFLADLAKELGLPPMNADGDALVKARTAGLSYSESLGLWQSPIKKKSDESENESSEEKSNEKPKPKKLEAPQALRRPLDGQGSLVMVAYDSNVMDDQSANCKWLSEIEHENSLYIHQDDAKNRGIRQGDKVRISRNGLDLILSAQVCQSVAPGVVATGKGFGHLSYSGFAEAKRWRDSRTGDPDAWLVWWEENGENIHFLGGESVMSVEVEKA